MQELDRIYIPVTIAKHIAIGILEKSGCNFNWYMINSGDGTSLKAEDNSNRAHMLEIFYGIPKERFIEMFVIIDLDRNLRKI